MMPRLTSFLRRMLVALPLVFLLNAAQAQLNPADLPPVDSVFIPKATAVSRDRIEVSWTIAKGYYLYRHRIGVQALGGFDAGTLQLPDGAKHHDEFFGDVETYRGSVTAVLPGKASADAVSLRIKYQGCADAGICYPPQTRTLSVTLPANGDSAATGDASFNALGNALGGGRSLAAQAAIPGQNAAPLPPGQAFRVEAIADGGSRLLLRIAPAKGYYVYRDKLKLRLEGATGIALAAPLFPKAKPYHDEHFGNVQVYFDEVTIPVPLRRTVATATDATLHAEWQGCQDNGICYPPMRGNFRLALPAAGSTETTTAVASAPQLTAAMPVAGAAGAAAAATVADGNAAAPASNDSLANAPPADTNATPASAASATPVPSGVSADTGTTPHAGIGLALALLLALLGGVILNLMPCVLPVLSLKALSLAQSGKSLVRARRHALFYSAGILAAMAALWVVVAPLKRSGVSAGWGFWMQSPLVVGGLGLVMFALGLSLSGLWALPGFAPRLIAEGSGHDSARGDFLTGVLAVIVATPCTGPFMVTALAYAFGASALASLLVFLALGLGLALPVLLIGWIPGVANRLPRPGAWMETLKQLLAFPMYLAAAWLVWVLAHQRGADAVGWWALAAIALAFAVWAWHHVRGGLLRALAVGVGACLLAFTLWQVAHVPAPTALAPQSSPDARIQPWTPQRLAQLRSEGRVVFVNITADWCITCKANEKTVFSRPAFRSTLEANDAVYLVGDYTNEDPDIAAYLQAHRAVGVPLYVVYGRGFSEGKVLPTVLTPGIVETALQAAAAGR